MTKNRDRKPAWSGMERMRGMAIGRKSPLCAVLTLGLLVGTMAFAGPVATFQLSDGSRLSAEILAFTGGSFTVREVEAFENTDLDEARIQAMDFGELSIEFDSQRRLIIPKDVDPAPYFRWAVSNRYLLTLSNACRADIRRYGDDRVQALAQRLEQDIAATRPRAAENRDLRLAHVVVTASLGDRALARELFRKVRADYPRDEVVTQLERAVLLLFLKAREVYDLPGGEFGGRGGDNGAR